MTYPLNRVGELQNNIVIANVSISCDAGTTTYLYVVPPNEEFILTWLTGKHPSGDVSACYLDIGSVNTTPTAFVTGAQMSALGTSAGPWYIGMPCINGLFAGSEMTPATPFPVLQSGDILTAKVRHPAATSGLTILCDVIGYLS